MHTLYASATLTKEQEGRALHLPETVSVLYLCLQLIFRSVEYNSGFFIKFYFHFTSAEFICYTVNNLYYFNGWHKAHKDTIAVLYYWFEAF